MPEQSLSFKEYVKSVHPDILDKIIARRNEHSGADLSIRVKVDNICRLIDDISQKVESFAPTAVDEYEFVVSHPALISLAEIAKEVSRDCPVFEVVVKGSEYSKFHNLLVHDSIVLKAKLIHKLVKNYKADSKFSEANYVVVETLLSYMKFLQQDVHVLDLTAFTDKTMYSYSRVTKALHWVREFPLTGAIRKTIVVRKR